MFPFHHLSAIFTHESCLNHSLFSNESTYDSAAMKTFTRICTQKVSCNYMERLRLHPRLNVSANIAWLHFSMLRTLVDQAPVSKTMFEAIKALFKARPSKESDLFLDRATPTSIFSTVQFYRCPNVETKLPCLHSYQQQTASFSLSVTNRLESTKLLLVVFTSRNVALTKRQVRLVLRVALLHWKHIDPFSLFHIRPCLRTFEKQRRRPC